MILRHKLCVVIISLYFSMIFYNDFIICLIRKTTLSKKTLQITVSWLNTAISYIHLLPFPFNKVHLSRSYLAPVPRTLTNERSSWLRTIQPQAFQISCKFSQAVPFHNLFRIMELFLVVISGRLGGQCDSWCQHNVPCVPTASNPLSSDRLVMGNWMTSLLLSLLAHVPQRLLELHPGTYISLSQNSGTCCSALSCFANQIKLEFAGAILLPHNILLHRPEPLFPKLRNIPKELAVKLGHFLTVQAFS